MTRKQLLCAAAVTIVVGLLLVVSVMTREADATCYDYWDSSLTYIQGQPVCAGWGTHCLECVTTTSACYHDYDSGASDCYFFEENQPGT